MKRKKTDEEKAEGLRGTWVEVCKKQKGLMVMMLILAVASAILLIIALTSALRPQNTVVIVGYGDVYGEIAGISGGYRRESWLNMLAYPILALVFGILHNLLTLRVYRKYGRDAALAVVTVSLVLIAATIFTLFRLIGEW